MTAGQPGKRDREARHQRQVGEHHLRIREQPRGADREQSADPAPPASPQKPRGERHREHRDDREQPARQPCTVVQRQPWRGERRGQRADPME